MKPDGKIQGVDVWVREWMGFGVMGQWCIADGDERHTEMWVNCDGLLSGDLEKETHLFPSREDALAHLRELEEKERPVIDLSTAKFGDRFFQRDGSVSPPYACPVHGSDDMHLMQDGLMRLANGQYFSNRTHSTDLVAPYTPPRTVIVQWMETSNGSMVSHHEDMADADEHLLRVVGRKRLAIVTLTEGEGL